MDEKIFISYARTDSSKVFEIRKEIETRLNTKCWIDLNGIESDSQFVDVIISAINRTEIFVFMYSQNSSTSVWTKKELEFAKQKNKHIVFIKIDSTPMTDWFLFEYGKYDVFDYSKEDQKVLAIKDLALWTGNKLPEGIIAKEDVVDVSFSQRNKHFSKTAHWTVILLAYIVIAALVVGVMSASVNQNGDKWLGIVGFGVLWFFAFRFIVTFRRKVWALIMIACTPLGFGTLEIFTLILFLCMRYLKRDGKTYWQLAD